MRCVALALAVVLAQGCRFDGDSTGSSFRCQDDGECPPGMVCTDVGHCAPISAVADASADDGLVAWYRMEEVEPEGRAVDETGVHDGVCGASECPVAITGKVGGALRFDGVDDHIRVADHAQFHSAAGTIAGWVYFGGTVNGAVVTKGYGPFDGDAWLLVIRPIDLAGGQVGYETAGGDVLWSAEDSFELERWSHLAGTWSATGKRLYIDGALVAEAEVTMDFDTRDILIGADEDLPDLVIPLAGAIDEVRIYDRELDPEQVAGLAQSSP